MKLYVINIVTTTKNKEFYERVAVNEYPLVIFCVNEDRLREILSSKTDYIKHVLKTEFIYNNAIYKIREKNLDDPKCILRDFEWKVKDIVRVDY